MKLTCIVYIVKEMYQDQEWYLLFTWYMNFSLVWLAFLNTFEAELWYTNSIWCIKLLNILLKVQSLITELRPLLVCLSILL